jgi:vacuolar protein-sorting-associated protein 4
MKEALMRLVRKMEEATHFYEDAKGDLIPCSPGDPRALESDWNAIPDKARIRLPPLTWADLVAAIRDTKPSVDKAELPRYESFSEATGVNG